MKKLLIASDFTLILCFNLFLTKNILASSIMAVSLIIGFYSFGIYTSSVIKSFNTSLVRMISGIMIAFFIVFIFIFVFRLPINRFHFLYNIFFVSLITFLQSFFYRAFYNKIPTEKILRLAYDDELSEVFQEITVATDGHLKIIDCPDDPEKVFLEENTTLLVCRGKLEDKESEIVTFCIEKGINVEYLPLYIEKYLYRTPVEVIKRFPEYYNIAFSESKVNFSNRVFDVLISSLVLILSSPIILLSIILIKLEDGKEIFFKQKRYGMNGKIFYVYKLRTMNRVQENGEYVDKPTKIGKILRKFRINELPQIFNIFKGEMSLVGPRPDIELNILFCEGQIPFYHIRRAVPQGITGNAQVLYEYVDRLEKETYSKRLSYDIYFVKNYSFSLYFTTLLRTVETVVFGRGK